MNWLILNLSHWISNIKHFNSFSSMIATICFLAFLSILVTFKDSREKYEKEERLRQKESEQLRLQEYTDEIVRLYYEIKGFRHDYASMLTSMSPRRHRSGRCGWSAPPGRRWRLPSDLRSTIARSGAHPSAVPQRHRPPRGLRRSPCPRHLCSQSSSGPGRNQQRRALRRPLG